MSRTEVEIPKHPESLKENEFGPFHRESRDKEGEIYTLYDFLINNNLIDKYKEYTSVIFHKLCKKYDSDDMTTKDYEIAFKKVFDVLEPYLDQEPRDTFTLENYEMDIIGIESVQHIPMKEIREELKRKNQMEELKMANESLIDSVRYWCNKVKTCRNALQERGMNLEEFGLEDLPF